MKMKFCLASLVMLTACSSLRFGHPSGVDVDPRIRIEQETELQKADLALESMYFQNAEKMYADFQTRFPNSVFFQRAQLGRAKALEAQEKWAEAAELYRQTIESTRSRQPEITAQALYEISFCYENLGDEARVLSSLQDALKLKTYLTAEQAQAEIPARLAASFNRMGRIKDAEQYFQQADKGIQQIRATRGSEATTVWLSRTYYHMGIFSTHQLSYENLQASLDTLQMVQTFSLLSAEAGGEPWSKMAANGLTANYRDLWRTIQQIPLNKAMDRGAAQREQMDRQESFTGQMLTLINELKSYRSPERGGSNSESDELFMALAKLEKQAQDFLYSMKERNPLTPESEKRSGLKRTQ